MLAQILGDRSEMPETKQIMSGALNIDIFVLKLLFMAFKYMEPLALGLIKYESRTKTLLGTTDRNFTQ